jgi:AcrR family transcriptional regulator
MSGSAITLSEPAITRAIGYSQPVARWQPDAQGRLEKAAMELFQERGYARTTVGDIAERAGLTERTFFRYFVDKREVLFSGSRWLEDSVVEAVGKAPADALPLDIVAEAFAAIAAELQAHRDFAYVRARHAIVVEHAEVRERELIKMATLTTAVMHALRARGVPEPEASLAAEAGITVFKIGFERWVTAKKPSDFAAHVRNALIALRAVTASTTPAPRRAASNKARRTRA